MPYCVKCGVELNEGETKCPLCDTVVYLPDGVKPIPKPLSEKTIKERATVRYRRNRYTNIMGLCLFTLMFILLIINLCINGGINWSAIPLLSLAFVWFVSVFPVQRAKKMPALRIVLICIMAIAPYTILLDLLCGFLGWSLIVAASIILVCLILAVSIGVKTKVKDIISINAALVAVYVVIMDLLTGFSGWSLYAGGGLALLWSFTLMPMYVNRKHNVIFIVLLDSVLLLLYLFFCLKINGEARFFFPFVLPIVAATVVPIIAAYLLHRRCNVSVFGILSLCFFFVATDSLLLEFLINVNFFSSAFPFHIWSTITSSCCIAVSVIMLIIEKNRRLKEYLEKKLNI